MSELEQVGVVAELNIYPAKSMGGVAVPDAHLGWQGLDGDRRYAFVRTGTLNGLPWVSARQLPALVTYGVEFEVPETPSRSDVIVELPDGTRTSVRDQRVADTVASSLGAPVHLMRLHRGAFDAMAVSLITTRSISSIGQEVGVRLGASRFRANVLIDTDIARAYPEEKWVGRTLVFGGGDDPARVRVNRRDDRCSVIDVNPQTGIRDIDVLRHVVAKRRNTLGVYGSPERTGTIRIGDSVYIRRH